MKRKEISENNHMIIIQSTNVVQSYIKYEWEHVRVAVRDRGISLNTFRM